MRNFILPMLALSVVSISVNSLTTCYSEYDVKYGLSAIGMTNLNAAVANKEQDSMEKCRTYCRDTYDEAEYFTYNQMNKDCMCKADHNLDDTRAVATGRVSGNVNCDLVRCYTEVGVKYNLDTIGLTNLNAAESNDDKKQSTAAKCRNYCSDNYAEAEYFTWHSDNNKCLCKEDHDVDVTRAYSLDSFSGNVNCYVQEECYIEDDVKYHVETAGLTNLNKEDGDKVKGSTEECRTYCRNSYDATYFTYEVGHSNNCYCKEDHNLDVTRQEASGRVSGNVDCYKLTTCYTVYNVAINVANEGLTNLNADKNNKEQDSFEDCRTYCRDTYDEAWYFTYSTNGNNICGCKPYNNLDANYEPSSEKVSGNVQCRDS